MPKLSLFQRLKRLFAGERATLAAQLAEEAFPRFYPTRLEDRQVLDGVPLVQIDAQGIATITAGAAANDGQADTFEATRIETDSGSMLQIKVNHETAAQLRLDDVRQLRFEGSNDADTLILDSLAVPVDGVEFVGNAIGPADVNGGAAPGVDRLILQGSAPLMVGATPGTASGGVLSPGTSGPGGNVSLSYQFDASRGTVTTASGDWHVGIQDIEHVIDELVVDDRQVVVAAGLNVDLHESAEQGPGWTTVEVVGGPTLDLRNPLESLGVTATHVTVSGNVDVQSADLRLTATESLTIGAAGQVHTAGGTIQLVAPRLDVDGIVDVGAGGTARLDVGSTGFLTIDGTVRAVGDSVGERGGAIELRGDAIYLGATAVIDARGDSGGGQILVGSSGDVSVDPQLGSRAVWIELGAVVDASAIRAGDGGRIIAWGTEGIVVDGALRATGGADAGNGGFIETSSHGVFSVTAAPLVTAPNGQGGTWLIDPIDLQIVSVGATAGVVQTGSSPSITFTSNNAPGKLSITTLKNAMGNGVTVELVTGPGAGSGNITLDADLDFNGKGNGTLKLTASGAIILNNSIYDSVAGDDSLNLILIAGAGTTSNVNANVSTSGGNVTFTGGNFTVAATKTIQTSGGSLTITTGAGNVITVAGGLNAGAGAITLTADDVALSGAADSIVGTGTITLQPLTASTSIGIAGGAGSFTLSTAEIATLANGFSQINIGRTNGTGAMNLSAVTFQDPVHLRSAAAGSVNVNGTLTGADNASISIAAAGAPVTIGANIVTSGNAVSITGNTLLAGAITIDTTNSGAATAGGAVSFSGPLDAAPGGGVHSLSVEAGTGGDVTFSNPIGNVRTLDTLGVSGDIVTADDIAMGTGNLKFTANDVAMTGGANSWTGSGTIILQPLVASATIGLGGAPGSFNLSTTDLQALANGFSQITIGRSDGTGGINMLAVTFRDPVSLLSPLGGTIRVDGTLTGTGDASIFFDGAGTTTILNANIVTAGATVTFSDNVKVTAAVTIDTTNGGAVVAGADVDFQGTLDATPAPGTESLTIIAGTDGNVTFTGAVGALDPLTSLTVTGDVVTASAITMGPGNLTITANDVAFTGGADSVSGTGDLILRPLIASTTIGIAGGAGAFSLSTTDLAALADGFAQILIGRINSSGGINIDAATFRDPVVFHSPSGGTIAIDGALTATGNGAFTFRGDVKLDANVVTAGGPIVFEENVLVTSAATVDATAANTVPTGANISFQGAIDATAAGTPESLTVNGGSAGDVLFDNDVGTSDSLDFLDVTGNLVTLSGDVVMGAGALTLTANDLAFGGGANSISGTGVATLQPLDPASSVGLGGAAGTFQLSTADLNALANGFSQIIIGRADSTGTMTINSSTYRDPMLFRSPNGLISVAGTVTGTGDASLTFVGDTELAANVVSAGAEIAFQDAVTVLDIVKVDATAAGTVPAGADISFLGTVDGTVAVTPESLTIDAGTGGNVTFGAAVGSIEPLDALDVTGNVVTADAIAMGAGDLTLTANDIIFTGGVDSITGTGTVTVQPLTPATTIGVAGGAGTFTVTTTDLATLADGFAQIIIGRADGTGGINIDSSSFRDPVLFRSPDGGTIEVDGAITGTGDTTFTFDGVTNLGADIETQGGAVLFLTDVTVDAAVTIDTTSVNTFPSGANVEFQGTVDATVGGGAKSLAIRAGTDGDVLFDDTVGATRPLDALDVVGHVVDFANTVEVAGPLNVLSTDAINFDNTVTTTGGAGDVTLTNGGLLTIANGADFTLDGEFLQNGAGSVSLGGDVLTPNKTITFTSPITLTADVLLNSNAAAGTGAAITLGGDVSGYTAAEALTLTAGVDGDISAAALGTGTGAGRLGGLAITSARDVTATSIATADGLNTNSRSLVVTGATNSWNAPLNITVTNAGPALALQLDDVDTHGQSLTISSGGTVTFTGGADSVQSSTGGGSLVLQGLTAATTLGFGTGAAGTMSLNDTAIAAIGPGFTGGIFFGAPSQSGTVTLTGAAHSYDQNVVIRANGGATVDFSTALDTLEDGADNKFVTILGNASTTVNFVGSIATDGGAITIVANTLQIGPLAAATFTTSGAGGTAATAGDVNFSGLNRILGTGGSKLFIDSRKGAANDGLTGDGVVDLPPILGSALPALSLALVDVRTDTGGTILRNAGGNTTVEIQGTAGSNALFLNGPVQLTGTTTITVFPGDVDLSEATFSSKGGVSKSLSISTVDGGALPDGEVRMGATNAAGGSLIGDLTITTADGLSPAGQLVFEHSGTSPLTISLKGSFLHVGERVILADSTTVTTTDGDILLNGDIDGATVGLSLILDATASSTGTINPGEIGVFGGSPLAEVQLKANATGLVELDEPITIDDPTGTSAGIVISGPTKVFGNVELNSELGNNNSAAPINLSGASIFGNASSATLTLDSSTIGFAAGQVTLGAVGTAVGGSYLNQLTINSSGAGGGAPLILTKGVLLDDDAGNASSFLFLGGDVIVADSLTIDTEQGGDAPGGNINFGASNLSANVADKVLILDARGKPNGGFIDFNAAGNAGGQYLGGLVLQTNGSGRIQPQGNLFTDAASAITNGGVRIEGTLALSTASGSTWSVDTGQGSGPGNPIDLDQATVAAFNPGVNVDLNSSGSTDAGAIRLGSFDPPAGLQRINHLTVTANGGSGDDGDVTFSTALQVDGTILVAAAKDVLIQDDVESPVSIELHGSGAIQGEGMLISPELTMVAGTGIYGSSPTDYLLVRTETLDARTTNSGSIRIQNVNPGNVTINTAQAAGNGSVVYDQTGPASLLVAGDVSASGTGSVSLTTDGNVTLGPTSLLSTEGLNTQIVVAAGGTLTLAPGGLITVGTNAANPGVVAHVPPIVAAVPQTNGGPDVDGNGDVVINVFIGNPAPIEQGFDITVNWADGSIVTIPNQNGYVASIDHHYEENPDPDNPDADIPITIEVAIDERILLSDNNGTNFGSTTINLNLTVAGTFFTFVRVEPTAIVTTPRVVTPLLLRPATSVQNTVALTAQQKETGTIAFSAPTVQNRQFVLRIVLPEDPDKKQEPIESNLSNEMLDDLEALFKRLPDGRYQIWLKLEDGSRQLVKDFYVRDGKAIDLEELAPEAEEDGPVRASEPARPAPADEFMFDDGRDERNFGPRVEPAWQTPPASSDDSPALDRAASADWGSRAREALGQVDERAFSKARRLLRRGSV